MAAFVRSLPDHSLLDRIVRGRAWIPLLGVMLAGIVAMQVEVLKLGASIGRSLQRSSALESRNELLRASIASLADDQRIERLAAGMGMIMPAPDAVGFLSATPSGDANQALANIHAPDPAGFLSLLSSNGSVVTAPTQAAASAPTQAAATAPTQAAATAPTATATPTQAATAGQSPTAPQTQAPASAPTQAPASAPTQAPASAPTQAQATLPAQPTPTGAAAVQPAGANQTSGISGG